MHNQNPIQKALAKQMKQILVNEYKEVDGIIEDIDFSKRTCSIHWRDPKTYANKYSREVPLPEGKSSVYGGEIQRGDFVVMGFKNSSLEAPYIIKLSPQIIKKDYESKNGASIPSFFNRN